MSASVIHEPHTSATSGHRYPSTQGDGPPNVIGGYPPPVRRDQFQQFSGLQPLQPKAEPPPWLYPPPDQRGGYYDNRHPPRPAYGRGSYPSSLYAYQGQPTQGPRPPNGRRDYCAQPATNEYRPGGHSAEPHPTLAAPGQRTSIACLFCRKRKIRCSGYQSAPGGTCQNCVRRNLICIFRPVSSSNSTAFVPVSAVPGGVPPGTQLFGAYGQPLDSSSVPAPHPPGPQQHPLRVLLPLHDHYSLALTPAEPFSPSGEAGADGGSQVAGKRRCRTSEEPDEGCRPPPLRAAANGATSRRPPGEVSSLSSPGRISPPPYPGTKQNPRNPGGTTLPQPVSGGIRAASAMSGRSPTLQNGCNGASTPALQGQISSQQPQQGNSSIMSLSNLVDKNDMD
ncbi:putative C6 transcription factor [Dactylonectria macrodidyma]|uniref:C6 transcription factor n=1 Tax=Dactylonectria macrodidyma TaxID=307937 RepID=A0A9P9CXV1_9HYPO|nr:putative C6 transcription factor [Dactylonectria macrodidyma]